MEKVSCNIPRGHWVINPNGEIKIVLLSQRKKNKTFKISIVQERKILIKSLVLTMAGRKK